MKPKLLFIHRSVGHNLIRGGELYTLVEQAGSPFVLSDFDQNTGMLTEAGGAPYIAGWHIPGDNTSPGNYANLFSAGRLAADDPTLKAILSYDIIALKSCFPNTRITSDAMLEQHKQAYKSVVDFFSPQLGKKLAILTSPPLIPLLTLPPFARRARALANWLSTTDFGPNVFVFDFFNELASPQNKRQANTLRREYRCLFPLDSHPNVLPATVLAPKVATFFTRVAEA